MVQESLRLHCWWSSGEKKEDDLTAELQIRRKKVVVAAMCSLCWTLVVRNVNMVVNDFENQSCKGRQLELRIIKVPKKMFNDKPLYCVGRFLPQTTTVRWSSSLFWKIQTSWNQPWQPTNQGPIRCAEVDVSTLQNFHHVCEFNMTCLVSGGPSGLMHVTGPITEAPVNGVFWGFYFYF